MKITIKKRSLSVVAGVLSLVLIGGAWAYYHNEASLENKLSTKTPGGEQLVEEFTPQDNWQPGDTVNKKAGVENKGEVPLIVRVKMNEVWSLADGSTTVANNSKDANFVDGLGQDIADDGLTTGDGSVVAKNMTLGTSWTYNPADGYWYYNSVLASGANTGNFLTSITLDAGTDMGLKGIIKYYTKAPTRPADDQTSTNAADADTKWVVLTGDMPTGTTFSRSVSSVDAAKAGYAGADYSLFITYETYQATSDAIDEATTTGNWDEDFVPTV